MARNVSQAHLMTGILLVFATFPFALGKFHMFEKTLLQGSTNIPFLRRWTTPTKVHCAIACAGQSECKSFSVLPNLHECSLYASRITAKDILAAPSSEEETFYWKQNGVCPLEKGYAIVPGTHKCLRMSEAAMTWTEAEAICEAEGGHLAIIEDLPTWGAVRAFLETLRAGLSSGIFVGGRKTSSGQWLWVDGRAVEESLWASGQPDFPIDWDACLSLWWAYRPQSFVILDDTSCGYVRPFLCEV